ncbi:MAG: DNA cytosine methyltransferase [Bacteroidota bacterium]|nr:DNA cytosine methyltransferase [Bacteroidota bacterium]
MKTRVFDFFSGCGGASRGFEDAGMEVVYALDWDPDARRSFSWNFPRTYIEGQDIRRIHEDAIAQFVKAKPHSPVLFCGCAPCQPFTSHRTRQPSRQDDQRVELLLEFLRFVRKWKPDIVFVENVPGIQDISAESEPLRTFLNGLKQAGYAKPACKSVSMKWYGVPQGRRRFLLLASRHGKISIPPGTHGPNSPNPSFATVKDYIGALPPIKAGETHPRIPDHRAAELSALNLKRIQATPEGGGNMDWPPNLRLRCHRKINGYSDVYGRMAWDRPAPGLTTRCISYSNGRFGHPDQHRAISIREAACLQTFPMDFHFAGNMNSKARQIGNAVPVLLADVVGRHIEAHLFNRGGSADNGS